LSASLKKREAISSGATGFRGLIGEGREDSESTMSEAVGFLGATFLPFEEDFWGMAAKAGMLRKARIRAEKRDLMNGMERALL
jgi:hypothetical protein